MADSDNKKGARLAQSTFRSVMGVETTRHTEIEHRPTDMSVATRMSPYESKKLATCLYVKQERRAATPSATSAIAYLNPIFQATSKRIIDAGKLRALAPEIEQSRILVSSAIMSPNDLQDGVFNFSFEDVPAVQNDPDLLAAITDAYDQMFNKTLDLGILSYDWIGEAQYVSGAKAILILPPATQIDAIKHDVRESLKTTYGLESFEETVKKTSKDEDFFFSVKPYNWSDFFKENEKVDENALFHSMESFGITFDHTDDQKEMDEDLVKKQLKHMDVTLRTKLTEGDILKISENPELIRFHHDRSDLINKTFENKLGKKYKNTAGTQVEELLYLNPDPVNVKHFSHPALIQLPTEAVIPIHVPGAPSKHIGYFILLDQNGQPLEAKDESSSLKNSACDGVNTPYEAMFGNSCCNAMSGFKNANSAGNLVFNNIFDKYVKERMRGVFGKDDLTISRQTAISTVMFYRLLENKRTTMVFVPCALLHYFAFDHREDGCGKSKIEDIQFLLSLRTTLMVTKIVAMMNDAVERKKIEFSLDEKNANPEALMDAIEKVFNYKNRFTGSIDPAEISKNITENSLTIVPKNLPGLSDMTVDISTGGNSSTQPDDSINEQITKLIESHLDAPSAALSQMSEPEFARSIVTNHLFFAKKISRYQRIWCGLMTMLIRSYSQYDVPFRKSIANILKNTGKKVAHTNVEGKAKKIAKKNPNQFDSHNELLEAIFNNAKVQLPSPSIAADKSIFEEVREHLTIIDELAERIFSSDTIMSDNQTALDGLNVAKAAWKRSELMRVLENVSTIKIADIPSWDNIDPSDIMNSVQVFLNFGKGLKLQQQVLDNAEEGGFGGDGGFSDDGGGDDFGDDGGMDDMGGDMGDDDRGGEIDMGEPEEEPVEDVPSTDTSEESDDSSAASMYLKLNK